jgi:TPP-dependent pyruvate/acetoin dehydrogenase alpha subunit
VVDGMQIWQVQPAVEEAVERARKGEGPTLIEAKTYRYRGHSRSDPRAYRTKEEEQHYHDRDPIKQYRDYLIEHKVLTAKEFEDLQDKVDENIAYAERFSLEESPYPDPAELYEDVYAGWIEGPRRLEKV